MSLTENLNAARRDRERRAERRINYFRMVAMVVLGTVDGMAMLFTRDLPPSLAYSAGTGLVAATFLCGLVWWLTRKDAAYLPWLKYVVVTLDLGFACLLFVIYRAAEFPPWMGSAGLATHMGAWFMVVLMTCAFRTGRPIIAYATVAAIGACAFVGTWDGVHVGVLGFMPISILLVSILVHWLSISTTQMVDNLRTKEQLMRFLSKELVASVERGEVDLKLGGVKRRVTVLMSDIRGFTRMSETKDPYEVVTILNEYFGEMTRVVFENGGVIDKFIGDAILAVYGAPMTHADDADRALKTALEMRGALDALNARWRAKDLPELDIGIALHTGEVVSGNIGSPDRMEYTIIGDTVNVTSRLESMNKTYGTWLLVSEATREAVTGEVHLDEVAKAEVRGREQPVTLFTVPRPVAS